MIPANAEICAAIRSHTSMSRSKFRVWSDLVGHSRICSYQPNSHCPDPFGPGNRDISHSEVVALSALLAAATALTRFTAQSDPHSHFAPGLSVVGGNHRIVGVEAPPLAVSLRAHVVLG